MSYFTSQKGSGKSLYVAFMINWYFENYDNVFLSANQHFFKVPSINPYFDEKRFSYSPLSLIRRDILENREILKIIVIDDNENIKETAKYWIKTINNWSRKTGIIIYLVGHYYTSVSRELRHTLRYRIVPNFIKSKDWLEFEIINTLNDEIIHRNIIKNVSRFYSLYDTNEVVPLATDSLLISELKKYVDTYQDLEYYARLLFAESKLEKKIKKFSEILNLR